ncbi:hypothetical protein BBP00_00008334 [Phytophthora kernoviae]|uniref:WLM domain-containing protein n=3 Tax=Phytophthora kernoviae TaxID=325452 RepID=A0A3F2RFP7_9STRA|nr:hypothetical protein BBP00_00008334 [Phytophthora kernoviae]
MTTIDVQFKGETHSIALTKDTIVTVAELQVQIESRFNVQPDAQRLFQKRRRVDCSDVTLPLADVCDCTSSLLLMAGASAAQIEDMKVTQDAMKKEMKIRESRRVVNIEKKNQAFVAQEAVSTTYRFHVIEPLKQFADADKAREILEKLANDRGILAVMAKYKWSVGVLAEMPPDGKVGVDPVCVLGLNQNKGQKILLRLRTDDFLGFRKFLSIKKVIFHELSHNVHSEHDSKFYQLMRLIEKECNELDWTSSHGDRERRIHDAVRHLQVHYNADTIAKAVSLLHKIISNIITHPADAKFRSIKKANRLFEGQVARFPECLEFLLALGFEDQSDKFVLVREDPALLWIGRSTLEVLLSAAA